MDVFVPLIAREDPNQGCTKETCPVSQSVYGYTPNLPATVIFLVIFAVSGLIYTWQGIKSRTWFFSTAMAIGCICEVVGYVAKIILHNDPFSFPGFIISVVMLTPAPAFYAAGIYYTLQHICLTFDPSLSRLPPAWYTYLFIACDCFSIILQAVGGAVASASQNEAVLRVGDDVAIAGLTTQVFTLLVFCIFAADYAYKVYHRRESLNPETEVLRSSRRFRWFLVALTVAYFAILIRCCYRVAELAKGWGPQNGILRTQGLFIGLDSVPCAIATIVLNIWHPGWCFPKHHRDVVIRGRALASKDVSSAEDEAEKGAEESS